MRGAIVLGLISVAAMAATAVADAGYGHGYGHGHAGHDYYAVPKYAYQYGIQDKATGDFKNHHEERHGGVTRGSYSLLQPDGVLRTVKYFADKTGFHAQVINSGHGVHPF